MARRPGPADAIAYSIPLEVENHPVRKVDHDRQREAWRMAVVVAVMLGGLLVVAWQHSQWRDLGYELARLQKARAAGEAEQRHLRLELETLCAPERIERLAIRDLRLVAPSQTEAVVLERVRQAAAPDRSLVARRLAADGGVGGHE